MIGASVCLSLSLPGGMIPGDSKRSDSAPQRERERERERERTQAGSMSVSDSRMMKIENMLLLYSNI